LFQNTIECARRKVIRRLTGNSDAAGFVDVLELPVAAACYNKKLAILLDQANGFANFH
jgi:hypothetical protein